jgi:hypothetical protein
MAAAVAMAVATTAKVTRAIRGTIAAALTEVVIKAATTVKVTRAIRGTIVAVRTGAVIVAVLTGVVIEASTAETSWLPHRRVRC